MHFIATQFEETEIRRAKIILFNSQSEWGGESGGGVSVLLLN